MITTRCAHEMLPGQCSLCLELPDDDLYVAASVRADARRNVPPRRRGLPARRSTPRRRNGELPAKTDWEAVCEALWERSGGLCEVDGLPLPADFALWDRHHRLTREYGDDTLPNLIAAHKRCHVVAPGSIHMEPNRSKERGLIIPSSARRTEPAKVGLWLPDGRLVRLTEEGPYELIMEGDA